MRNERRLDLQGNAVAALCFPEGEADINVGAAEHPLRTAQEFEEFGFEFVVAEMKSGAQVVKRRVSQLFSQDKGIQFCLAFPGNLGPFDSTRKGRFACLGRVKLLPVSLEVGVQKPSLRTIQ